MPSSQALGSDQGTDERAGQGSFQVALGYSLAAGQGRWRVNAEQVTEHSRGWSLTGDRQARQGVIPSCLPVCCSALGRRLGVYLHDGTEKSDPAFLPGQVT